MALIKIKELDNGTTGEYWVAETRNDKNNNTTGISLLLFKDKEARDAGKAYLLNEMQPYMEGTYLTGKKVYAHLTKSRLETTTETSVDEEGNQITNEVSVETNWFVDAIED